jgi:hypothetical protein
MLSKAKIAVAVVLVLGLASAAQAGGRDDADSSGGYVVTPNSSGVNPALHPEIFGQPEKVYDSVRAEKVYDSATVPPQPVQKKPQPVQKKK